MNPLVWGPPFWFVMHTVSLNYPLKPTYAHRRTHYDFFYNIRNILPCEMCRQHYRTLLKRFPIEPFLDNRETLVSWVILIHNQVNIRLGKPTMTKNAVLQKYSKAYERQSFCQAPYLLDDDDSDKSTNDVYGTSTVVATSAHQKRHTKTISRMSWKWVLLIVLIVFLVVCGGVWLYRNRPR